MRILNTGTEVEAAVADALLLGDARNNKVDVYPGMCDLESLSSLPSESLGGTFSWIRIYVDSYLPLECVVSLMAAC
jgi:hypothetical protein